MSDSFPHIHIPKYWSRALCEMGRHWRILSRSLKTITLAGWERSTSTFLVTNCFLILCDPGVRRERKKEFTTSSLPPTLSLKFQDFPEASLFAHFSNLTWPILEYQSNYLHYASSGPFGHYQKDHCKEKLYMCFKSLRSYYGCSRAEGGFTLASSLCRLIIHTNTGLYRYWGFVLLVVFNSSIQKSGLSE